MDVKRRHRLRKDHVVSTSAAVSAVAARDGAGAVKTRARNAEPTAAPAPIAPARIARDALRALVHLADTEGFASLALPRLATGVGGLDWSDVRPVIEERLGGLGIPVYVYSEFHAGQQAEEPTA